MLTLDLTEEERGELHAILASDLTELRMEIAGTDDHDFRERLKRREVIVRGLLERLGTER